MGKPHLKQLQRIREDTARKQLPNHDSLGSRTGMSYYELPSQFVERLATYHNGNGNLGVDGHRDSDQVNRKGRLSDSDHDDNRRSRSPVRSRYKDDSNSEGDDGRDYRRGRDRDLRSHSRQDSRSNGTSSSAYPVIPTRPNDEYRPKMEPEIKKVNGQFYCEPCDTYCARMDVMQAHTSGKNHKKKTKQIARYACDLCLIEVSSAETLQTHYQGMSHIKRAKVVEEAKKETEYMTNSSQNEMEELADLRQRCQKLERQNANLQKEVDQLLKFKKNCLSTHYNVKTEALKNDLSYNSVVLQ